MNYSKITGNITLQSLFDNDSDIEQAARYLALFRAHSLKDGGTLCYRDLSGHFYAVVSEPGTHPKTIEYSEQTAHILDRLQRGGLLKQAAKPEYFTTGNGGFRMTVAPERAPHNV